METAVRPFFAPLLIFMAAPPGRPAPQAALGPGGAGPVGQLDEVFSRGVYHRGVPIFPDTGEAGGVLQVDVAVEVVAGLKAVHQALKAGEALVAGVVHVAHPLGGGVGDEDIHPAPAQGPAQLGDAPAHLALSVLVDAAVILLSLIHI